MDREKDPGGAMICENNGRETKIKKSMTLDIVPFHGIYISFVKLGKNF